jgi:tannase
MIVSDEEAIMYANTAGCDAIGVAVVTKILEGLKYSDGNHVYVPYQPDGSFFDGQISWNNDTSEWELDISALGSSFPIKVIDLQGSEVFESNAAFDNVTYDTLKAWMWEGWQKYEDTMQTTNPDLTYFQQPGGKIIHFHGESDNSIPTAASVGYHESVRQVVYSNMTYNESTEALGDWYRFFIVPRAQHCATNEYEPNAPFPQTNLAVLITWVENGITPVTLNATVLSGECEGEEQQLCA